MATNETSTEQDDPGEASRIIDLTIRKHWGRILASLTKTLGNLQLAEDSLQDAVESALIHWKRSGLPNSPPAWLLQTARRKAIDRIRRDRNFKTKADEISYLIELDGTANAQDGNSIRNETIPDERLRMVFTCCHPAIEEKSRIALTLRTIGGLTTEEIARAFLDKTEAMAARLTRAKKKITLAKIPYEIPQADALAERLNSVLNVIYLIYNEGYSALKGENLYRDELIGEALRLAGLVRHLLPQEPEPAGLEALILLHESRREARTDTGGNMVPLEYQDRTCWDQNAIADGIALLKEALGRGKIGPYQLQAAISACHLEAPDWAHTDWAQIAALYELLSAMQPSPVVKLNYLYALSHTRQLAEVLELVDELAKELESYQPFHAARADILNRAGKYDEARSAYQRAITLCDNTTERTFLEKRLAVLPKHETR